MPADIFPTDGRIIRILFCRDGQVRMRTIVSRSRAQPTFRYPSWKLGRGCEGEGYELDALRLADCDPAVKWFAEQCCEITYLNDFGEEEQHYPDLLLFRHGKFTFWEEKTTQFAETASVQARTELLKRELSSVGYSYEIKLAEELAIEPRLAVVKKLLRHGRRPMTLVDRWNLQHAIACGSKITWAQACTGVFGEFGREILCRAVLEGILAVDIDMPIKRETTFFPGTLEVW